MLFKTSFLLRWLPVLRYRIWIKDTLIRLSTVLKASNKSVWNKVFWYVKVCILWKFIEYTIHWDKTNLKKNPFRENKRYKNALFFLSWAPTHHSFTFNLQLLDKLKHKVRPSKTVCEILDFRFRFVFIKVYILFRKIHGLFDFKTS